MDCMRDERLSLAREYMNYGFTALRDLGTMDPEWPTVDLRNAINAGRGRTSAHRDSAHLECERGPRRSRRLLQPSLNDTGLGHPGACRFASGP